MKIAVISETAALESRVAATPETIKKLIGLGATVSVEAGAGKNSGIPDAEFTAAGAQIAPSAKETLADAAVVLKVRRPTEGETSHIPKGALVLAIMDPYDSPEALSSMAKAGLSTFSMELMPRITRAQVMDVLSSQANLAGYRAVIDASSAYGRGMPMMMTAAGTVPAAKVFVMGAGVAGLQAIATARRLGAIVTATDVRPAAKEQVASLGAKFIAVEDDEFKQAETAAGYAKPMSAEYQAKQAALVASHIAKQDIVITTALIPGRPAPKLVSEEMVRSMRAGSVIIDIAAGKGPDGVGGNCPLTEAGKTVIKHGVTLVGETNLPALVAADASALYARNVLDFLKLIINKEGALHIDMEDDIVAACLMTRDGAVVKK